MICPCAPEALAKSATDAAATIGQVAGACFRLLVINLFRTVLAYAQAGSRTVAVKDLIDRFVLVGVPDRYMPERWPAN